MPNCTRKCITVNIVSRDLVEMSTCTRKCTTFDIVSWDMVRCHTSEGYITFISAAPTSVSRTSTTRRAWSLTKHTDRRGHMVTFDVMFYPLL